METLEKLKEMGAINPFSNRLPTIEDVNNLEKELNILLPNSYKTYLLDYSNISLGVYELLKPFRDNTYLDMVNVVESSREMLPPNLIPFLYDNGDYFCFNLNKNAPDYEIVFWSHNGQTDEKWPNFITWVEKCWIGEQENQDNGLLDDFMKSIGL